MPLSKWGAALRIDDHAGYGVLDHRFGELWNTFERQQRFQQWIGLLAPLVALRSFSMGLAGTDFSQHRHFSTAAETQRRIIQDIVSRDLIDHADPLGNAHFSYKARPDLWATVPRFDYRAPDAGFALLRHWPSLAVLAVMFILSLAFARYAFSRPLMR
ncbi:DUF3526 domain-containing protein [Bradyrhizobium sp. 200]|uniref:DUF3526 domain-containing protein n=1 Tax=Bradyrhizobium sp. 200 TaxID=2782665 RepID=UPI001FFE7AAE|nr:DUF3526 domain-containing protein [Bradyrhizobium sp. 200]